MKSRVGEKGQVTIPKSLRDSLGINPGEDVAFEERNGAIVVRRVASKDPLLALVGLVKQSVDVDAYLTESRGRPWNRRIDGKGR